MGEKRHTVQSPGESSRAAEHMRRGVRPEPEAPSIEELRYRRAVASEIMDEAGVSDSELHGQLTPDLMVEISSLGYQDSLFYRVIVWALRFGVAHPWMFRHWVHDEYRRRHGGKEDDPGD